MIEYGEIKRLEDGSTQFCKIWEIGESGDIKPGETFEYEMAEQIGNWFLEQTKLKQMTLFL